MSLRLPFNGKFRLSQKFGGNEAFYKQFLVQQPDGTRGPLKGHNGLDYALPIGTPVVAPHDGVVKEVSFDENGYGKYVKIESAKEGSVLAHLDGVSVSVGFEVKAGMEIGKSGSTGYSTGPHLHWGYYTIPRDRANGYGGFIDQEPLLGGQTTPVAATTENRTYTQEEYNTAMKDRQNFWEQRDQKIAELQELQGQYNTILGELTGFKAMGFENPDQLKEELKKRDETIIGLQTEIKQVLDRNTVVYKQLSQKDEEDATAIELGIDALKRVRELEGDVVTIAKVAGTSPEKGIIGTAKLLEHISYLRDQALKMTKRAQKEANVTDEQVRETATKYNARWLLRLFGLTCLSITTTTITALVGISFIL